MDTKEETTELAESEREREKESKIKYIQTSLDIDNYKKFKIICIENSVSASILLRQIVIDWVTKNSNLISKLKEEN
jgi:hypothetical protein